MWLPALKSLFLAGAELKLPALSRTERCVARVCELVGDVEVVVGQLVQPERGYAVRLGEMLRGMKGLEDSVSSPGVMLDKMVCVARSPLIRVGYLAPDGHPLRRRISASKPA